MLAISLVRLRKLDIDFMIGIRMFLTVSVHKLVPNSDIISFKLLDRIIDLTQEKQRQGANNTAELFIIVPNVLNAP